MKLVSLENITKYNELLNQKIVKSVNSVKPDVNGNVSLGTEKSTFNKVTFDTDYFSVATDSTYSFDLTGTDLENVSKENVNIRIVAKVVTAHNGFEVGDIAQLTTALDNGSANGTPDVCAYIRGNTLYVFSGDNLAFSIFNGTEWLLKSNVQIKAVLTAFIPDDGSILLIAEDQTNTSKLIGLPNGTLTWGGKTIAPVTGKIEWFAFNTAPDGYLVCNGANVSRETYADLFAVIGTTFGSGDGSTTFALPNLIDKFAQGSTTDIRVRDYRILLVHFQCGSVVNSLKIKKAHFKTLMPRVCLLVVIGVTLMNHFFILSLMLPVQTQSMVTVQQYSHLH